MAKKKKVLKKYPTGGPPLFNWGQVQADIEQKMQQTNAKDNTYVEPAKKPVLVKPVPKPKPQPQLSSDNRTPQEKEIAKKALEAGNNPPVFEEALSRITGYMSNPLTLIGDLGNNGFPNNNQRVFDRAVQSRLPLTQSALLKKTLTEDIPYTAMNIGIGSIGAKNAGQLAMNSFSPFGGMENNFIRSGSLKGLGKTTTKPSISTLPNQSSYLTTNNILNLAEESDTFIRKEGYNILSELNSVEGKKRLAMQFKKENPSFSQEQVDYLVDIRLKEVEASINGNAPRYLLEINKTNPEYVLKNSDYFKNKFFSKNSAHFSTEGLFNYPKIEIPKNLFKEKIRSHSIPGVTDLTTQKYNSFIDPEFSPGHITLGKNLTNSKTTLDHEIGHAIQKAGETPIDKELKNLVYPKTFSEKVPYLLNPLSSIEKINDLKYFMNESEPYSFLREQRRKMLEKGIIKDIYEEITPAKLLKARLYSTFNKNPAYKEGDRLVRITNPWKYGELSKIMNKAPAFVPPIAGIGLLNQMQEQEQELPKFPDGGDVKKFKNYQKFIRTLPDNLRPRSEEDHKVTERAWEDYDQPKHFSQAAEQGLYTPVYHSFNEDGIKAPSGYTQDGGQFVWHGTSVSPKTGVFYKSSNHPTLHKELEWYNSDDPNAIKFREKNKLMTHTKDNKELDYYQYVPRFEDGGVPGLKVAPAFKSKEDREEWRKRLAAEAAVWDLSDDEFEKYLQTNCPDGKNCINGVTSLMALAGFNFPKGNPDHRGKGLKNYKSNDLFYDDVKSGVIDAYTLNKQHINNLQIGDVLQYRYQGGEDATPYHAKILISGLIEQNGQKGYRVIHNGGERDMKSEFIPLSEIENEFNNPYTFINESGKEFKAPGLIITRPGYSLDIDEINQMNEDARRTFSPEVQAEIDNILNSSPTKTLSFKDNFELDYTNKGKEYRKVKEKINNILSDPKAIEKYALENRVSKDEVIQTFNNVVGQIAQESNFGNPGIGNKLEYFGEKLFKPKNMSIGPGQIRYSALSEDLKQKHNITKKKDLFDAEKYVPLMASINLQNRNYMTQLEKKTGNITAQVAPNLQDSPTDYSLYMYNSPGKVMNSNLKPDNVAENAAMREMGYDVPSIQDKPKRYDKWMNKNFIQYQIDFMEAINKPEWETTYNKYFDYHKLNQDAGSYPDKVKEKAKEYVEIVPKFSDGGPVSSVKPYTQYKKEKEKEKLNKQLQYPSMAPKFKEFIEKMG